MGILSFLSNERPRRTLSGQNEPYKATDLPETPEEWKEEYDLRRRRMVSGQYTLAEVIRWGMYRAIDDATGTYSPEAECSREADDLRFVQRVNAAALFRDGPTLTATEDADEASVESAHQVWARTGVADQGRTWADLLTGMGELGVEPVRFEDGVRLVPYDPEMVTPIFDAETSTRLIGVEIIAPYMEEPDSNGYGERPDAEMRTYKRRLTATEITVWVDGVEKPEMSGPHNLGVVPFVWMTCQPMPGDPVHGLPSSAGMEATVAILDSVTTQIHAVSKRYANPVPYIKGAKMDDADAFKLGRVVSGLPIGAEMAYLEPNMAGIKTLMEWSASQRAAMQSSRPEYIFHAAGANASGEALKVRAAQFETQVEELRGRVFRALADVTEMAVAMERGIPYDAESDYLTVTAPPVLSPDLLALLETLEKADGLKAIQRRDVIAALQTAGVVPDTQTADEYAQALEDREMGAASGFFRAPEAE